MDKQKTMVQKKAHQSIWWLCMLPSLLVMAMLIYEWSQDPRESRLLVEAGLCLVISVGCGVLIVRSFINREEDARTSSSGKRTGEQPKIAKPSGNFNVEHVRQTFDQPETPMETPSLSAAAQADSRSAVPSRPVAAGEAEYSPQSAPTPAVSGSAALSPSPDLPTNSAEQCDSAPDASDEAPVKRDPALDLPALSGFLIDELAEATSTASNEKKQPTLKLEIALTAPAAGDGKGGEAVKVELAVKGSDTGSATGETRKAVARLEEKIARIEAAAAKLEATKLEPAAEPAAIPPVRQEATSGALGGSSKFGTQELVRPLPDFKTVDEWLTYADHLTQRHNFDDAIKCYDKVAALDPASFVAWLNKGILLRKKGCFDDAIYCMNYALRVDPKHCGAITEKGLCLFHLGRQEQALAAFDKALSINAEFVEALAAKAKCLASSGKHKDALALYERALKIQPDHVDARKGKEESAAKAAANKQEPVPSDQASLKSYTEIADNNLHRLPKALVIASETVVSCS